MTTSMETIWQQVGGDIEEAPLHGSLYIDFGWPDEEPLEDWDLKWPVEEEFGVFNERADAGSHSFFNVALAPRWAVSAADQFDLSAYFPTCIPTYPELPCERWNLILSELPCVNPIGFWTIN